MVEEGLQVRRQARCRHTHWNEESGDNIHKGVKSWAALGQAEEFLRLSGQHTQTTVRVVQITEE